MRSISAPFSSFPNPRQEVLFIGTRLTQKVIVTAEYNDKNWAAYYRGYGWAEGELDINGGNRHNVIADIAEFYDNQRTDHAWNWCRINFLMHTPFVSMPSWREVADHLATILDDPAHLPRYLGIRQNHEVLKIDWTIVDHVAEYILRLIYARLEFEDQQKSQTTRSAAAEAGGATPNAAAASQTSAGTLLHWDKLDIWAAAYVLYDMLCHFQNNYALVFFERYPGNYLREYRNAQQAGGVNPLLEPPPGVTPEEYQRQTILYNTATWRGRFTQYLKSLA